MSRRRSAADARRQEVALTEAGAAAYAELDARSAADIGALLEALPDDGQRRVLAAMRVLEDAWDDTARPRTVTLRAPAPWTNAVLHAARRIYERAGFELDATHEQHSFGHDLVFETWSRDL